MDIHRVALRLFPNKLIEYNYRLFYFPMRPEFILHRFKTVDVFMAFSAHPHYEQRLAVIGMMHLRSIIPAYRAGVFLLDFSTS